jgi:hypothetical protein
MHLPTYKETDGTWRAAMQLPEELGEPLADAVLNLLVEEGLARPKYAAA